VRFGANYTPRLGWFHSWLDLDLDLDETRRDFAALRRLGLDHVRIFPIWPIVQPNRTLIRPSALDDIVAVVRVAAECGLDVVVDGLQGHLSSYDFLPSWVASWHRRNIFTDPEARSAEVNLIRALSERLAPEPNTIGLSLGNEFIQFAAARHPNRHAITQLEASAWLKEMLGAADSVWRGGLHTFSFDDDLFFDPAHPFTPEHATTLGDVTTVHSWIFSQVGPHLGKDHPGLATFARYLCELAVAWSDDPERPVWLQEVGAPLTHLSPAKVPDFIRATMRHLHGCDQLWGVTWWCSHDVSRTLADFPEVEYSLGLLDTHGRVKPAGHALAEAIADWSTTTPAPMDVLTFSGDDLPQARAETAPGGDLFTAWMQRALASEPATLARQRSRVPTA